MPFLGTDPLVSGGSVNALNNAGQPFGFGPGSSSPINMGNVNTVPPSGFVSSAQPIVNQNTNTAIGSATSNIINGGQSVSQPNYYVNATGSPTVNNQPSPSSGNQSAPTGNVGNPNSAMEYMANMVSAGVGQAAGALSSSYNLMLQNAGLANQGIQLQYNTALGNLNQQYGQAFQTLQTQHMNSVGSAVSQMAVADPLGVNSSSFANGYIGKINDMYSQQASFLTGAYNQQQVALQNGNAQAALGIQQSINSSNAQFGQQIAQLNTGLANAMVGIAQYGQNKQFMSAAYFDNALKSTDLTGVNSNMSTQQLETMFPNLFQIGSGAFDPDTIAQSIKQGTIQQGNIQLRNTQTNLDIQKAVAQYGNAIGIGGNGGGSSGGGNNGTLSTWGQGIASGGGSAALTSSEGSKVATQLTQMSTAASPQNIQGLLDFVNTGNDSKFASLVGGFVNGLFGANLGDITSSKDLISSGATYLSKLGIDPKSLSNLSNQTPETRAQVVLGILNSVQGQLKTTTNMNSKLYNLKPFAGDLDTANSALQTAQDQLTSYLAGSTASPSGSSNIQNGMDWESMMSNLNNAFKQ